jgi:hypothetical protein
MNYSKEASVLNYSKEATPASQPQDDTTPVKVP